MKRVAIIGGGMSGLAAAEVVRARAPGVEAVVFEASDHVGGAVETERTRGFVIEKGPDSILTEKPWALDLARRIGIEAEVVSTQSGPTGAYVIFRGRLERVPDGFALLAPTQALPLLRSPVLSWAGKFRAGLDLVLPRGAPRADESLGSFVRRRFGREVLEQLAQPLVGGIYGADADELSLRATMPRFLDVETKSRSVILGLLRRQASVARTKASGGFSSNARAAGARYGLFVSMRSGMQAFTDALGARNIAQTRTLVRVTAVRPSARGGWELALSPTGGGPSTTERFDGAILALQTWKAAEILEGVDSELAAELAAIPHASSANVTFAWPRSAIGQALDAFGFVVPEVEGRAILASTWASEKYPDRAPADMALIRVFLGGPRHQDLVRSSDSEIVDRARAEISELMRVRAEPTLVRLARHHCVLPLYHVGHLERVASIEQHLAHHPALGLAGNGLRGVGLPDVVHAGERAAEHVLSALGRPISSSVSGSEPSAVGIL